MQKIDGKNVLVKIPVEDLKRLEKIMKRHKLSKAQAVRNVLVMGLDFYEDAERLGIPQTVALFDGIKGFLLSKELGENPGLLEVVDAQGNAL